MINHSIHYHSVQPGTFQNCFGLTNKYVSLSIGYNVVKQVIYVQKEVGFQTHRMIVMDIFYNFKVIMKFS